MNLLAQKQHKKPIRAPVKQSHFTLAFLLDESFIHSWHGYGNKVSWVLSQTRVALQYPAGGSGGSGGGGGGADGGGVGDTDI